MPAAWSICGVDLDPDEEPDEGQIQFVRQHKYVYENAYGLTGRLKQKTYTDALDAKLHLFVSRATKDALKAVYDAHAADGTLTDAFINPEPPYDVGVEMKLTEFSAEWSGNVRGLPWFDCNLLLVEG